MRVRDFPGRGVVGDPDGERAAGAYGEPMVGVVAAALQDPVRQISGVDSELRFLVDKPLAILGILVGAFVVNKVARRLVKLVVRWLGRRRAQHGPGLVRRHAPAALLDTGQLRDGRTEQRIEALAAVLGVRLGPVLTGAGLIGVALGFGAQPLIRDFPAGVFILREDQLRVGDWVDAGEATDSVEAVTLRSTRIRAVAP
jgi:small conductance mechanosensitive channel